MKILNDIKDAIDNKQLVTFDYENQYREVEPHLCGTLGGKLQLHGYQVAGESHSGGIPEWRNFEIDKIKNIRIDRESTFAIRSSYHPENTHYTAIQKAIKK